MDAGRSCVSVRRSVQVVSGFVICQRPRVGSRAVIPSPRLFAGRCPRIGRDAFLERYGFDHARQYFFKWNGHECDSKAIAGAAHGHLPVYAAPAGSINADTRQSIASE